MKRFKYSIEDVRKEGRGKWRFLTNKSTVRVKIAVILIQVLIGDRLTPFTRGSIQVYMKQK